MKLHENKQLFRQSVQFTAQQMNILDIYIEKDYWVTFVLHAIYKHPIGEETVFKGGTALSKCFGLIERFSEDIDLIVLRREGESNNKLTNKIKEISSVVDAVLPEVEVPEVTQKRGMNRKTAHNYAKEFSGNFGQVKDVIIVEATWLGFYEPYTTMPVSSYIFQMMEKSGQRALAEQYGMLPFNVKVLDTKRTLCEKIMSMVRFSYTEHPLDDLKQKIRHAYDLHQLLQNAALSEFFNSSGFDKLLLKVANDDVASYRNNNEWLVNHPVNAYVFADLDSVWDALRSTYNGPFKNLAFGVFPKDADVLQSLKLVKDRLSTITWNIKI